MKYKDGKRIWAGTPKRGKKEAKLQREVAKFLDTQTDLLWYHPSPNAYRSTLAMYATPFQAQKAGAVAKQAGVKAGVPDIVICNPPPALKDKYGAYIELKVDKNYPSKEQKAWLKALDELGYYTTVCRDTLDNFKKVMLECGYEFKGDALFQKIHQE